MLSSFYTVALIIYIFICSFSRRFLTCFRTLFFVKILLLLSDFKLSLISLNVSIQNITSTPFTFYAGARPAPPPSAARYPYGTRLWGTRLAVPGGAAAARGAVPEYDTRGNTGRGRLRAGGKIAFG